MDSVGVVSGVYIYVVVVGGGEIGMFASKDGTKFSW